MPLSAPVWSLYIWCIAVVPVPCCSCVVCWQVVFEIIHYLERYFSTQPPETDQLLDPFGQTAQSSDNSHQLPDSDQSLHSSGKVAQSSNTTWSSMADSSAQSTRSDLSMDCRRCTAFKQYLVLHDWFVRTILSYLNSFWVVARHSPVTL